jgi:hypothetical protein
MKILLTAIALLLVALTNPVSGNENQRDSSSTSIDSSKVEKPADGLVAITDLYRAKDSKTLIMTRYSELPGQASEKMIAKMQNILDKRLTKKTFADQMLVILEKAQKSAPVLVVNPRPKPSETHQMATFEVAEGQQVKLYLMKTGLWGFHL